MEEFKNIKPSINLSLKEVEIIRKSLDFLIFNLKREAQEAKEKKETENENEFLKTIETLSSIESRFKECIDRTYKLKVCCKCYKCNKLYDPESSNAESKEHFCSLTCEKDFMMLSD